MNDFFNSELFFMMLNLGAYILGGILLKVTHIRFINTFFIALILIVSTLLLFDLDYQSYEEGSQLLSFFLGPSVVALGYVLHKQIEVIKKNISSVFISIIIGAVVNLLIINAIFTIFGTELSIVYSVQPKSVTTPIAISLSEQFGGLSALTAVMVTVSGVLGSVVGVPFLRMLRIEEPEAKGLALGAASHAIGTARALELGAREGAMGGLAIGLMGVTTSLLLSFFRNILL